MEKSPSQILQEARALVAAPGGWTQRVYRRQDPATGQFAYCAMGALMAAVSEGDELLFYVQWPARSPARAAHQALKDALPPGHDQVSPWNERNGRTQAEVVALYDRALTAITK